MGNFQKAIAQTVSVCLVLNLCGDWATTLGAATPPNPTLTRQQVELFGVGAAVKLKLASGEKVRGSVGAIEEHGFDLLSDRGGSPRRVSYDQVAELKLAKSTYKTRGAPNPEEARRVAAGLGVGKHVAVKVTSGETFRGDLQAINEDHLVLLPDREARTMEIAYGDVQALGPNLSKGAKIAIVVVVVVAAAVIILAVAVHETTKKLGL